MGADIRTLSVLTVETLASSGGEAEVGVTGGL